MDSGPTSPHPAASQDASPENVPKYPALEGVPEYAPPEHVPEYAPQEHVPEHASLEDVPEYALLEDLPEYASLEDVAGGLARLERDFRRRHDRRAVFATAYLVVTRALQRRLAAGGFQDGAWVARYAVHFGNLYRGALLAFDRGDAAALPKAWRLAFETSASGAGLVLQDLLLGVNAHINHDLPLALDAATIDPDRPGRYRDHSAVNNVLREVTDALQARIGGLYAPLLRLLDLAGGPLDEVLGNFATGKAREHAWVAAVALANARDDRERSGLRRDLDSQAAVLARLILAPTLATPWLPGALRHLESRTPWWTHLTVPDTERQMAAAAAADRV